MYLMDSDLQDNLNKMIGVEQATTLSALLKHKDARKVLAGLIVDVSEACKRDNLVEVAEAVNSWVATAEEMVVTRSEAKRQRILKARDEMVQSG